MDRFDLIQRENPHIIRTVRRNGCVIDRDYSTVIPALMGRTSVGHLPWNTYDENLRLDEVWCVLPVNADFNTRASAGPLGVLVAVQCNPTQEVRNDQR